MPNLRSISAFCASPNSYDVKNRKTFHQKSSLSLAHVKKSVRVRETDVFSEKLGFFLCFTSFDELMNPCPFPP